MGRSRFIADISFRTKMLVAVTVVMSLLVALALWLVSWQFKQQIHKSADDQLRIAEGALKSRQKTRADELSLRFNSVKNEPKVKAASQLLQDFTPDARRTIQQTLNDLLNAGMADVIVMTALDSSNAVPVARDPGLDVEQFASQCSGSIRSAFGGNTRLDVVKSNGHLFDVVTLPVTVSDNIIGAISFGVANSMPSEFGNLMSRDDDLMLLLNGEVADKTCDNATATAAAARFAAMTAKGRSGEIQEIVLGSEHSWALAGWLENSGQNRLGYLVLSSYEKPLQEMRSTERMVLLIGLLAILCGIAVVWFLLKAMTEPLLELQACAEAVGRGDFSRRVDIGTRDEFGALGGAFNQMTQSIEQSQSQLKQTVATLKTTQAQLIQSEKLSAVGEFVAGVAHELNNPLATVMGFSEMLQRLDGNEKHQRHLDLIFKSAQRCQKIVQSLLSFARRQKPERKPVLVNKLIEEVLEVVAYPLRTSNVQVVTNFSPTLPFVLADGHQIQQVVLNIINNARQAMEGHQDSGRITITTSSDAYTVKIVIQDNGPGISPENLRKIFDPFFTTKEVGKGTGLGLSLCYGMIHDHGGHISADSKLGGGATFTIELPAAERINGDTDTVPAAKAAAKLNPFEGGGKKVLAVDDEESLLTMIKEELSRHNFEVVTVNNGESALQILRQKKFDVIVCDIKMPGLNGRQVYERLRQENPEHCRRMMFVTGDIISDPLRQFLESENRPCLAKPFSLADLRQSIQATLERV